MANAYERPDLRAFEEVERLVSHLLEELAGWRRRSLRAEAELQQRKDDAAQPGGGDSRTMRARLAELEAENVELRRRADAARDRLRAILGRIAFLEEQAGGAA